ncbi:ABC transporter ATP-binding protein [Nakamurella sp.]|uniref:ABC transporter ATP-binding protein n=1 Tax=Nakamurella sp. TaxID=1869182 RepID=UPI003B39FBC6
MTTDPSTALPVADARATLRELVRGLRARPVALGGTVLLLITASVAALAIPALLGAIVDAITTGDASAIARLALLVGLAGVAQGALSGGAAVGVARIGERILADLRGRVVERALSSPVTRVETAGRGDLVARVTGDARVVGDAVSELIPTFVGAAFAIAVTGAGLAVIDGRMLLAALLAAPIQVVALRAHLRRSTPVYARARAAVGDRAQRTLEAVDATDTIRAMGWGRRTGEAVDDAGARAVDLELRAVGLEVRFWNRLNLAELVGLAAVLTAGFLLVKAGTITVGQATAAALYFHQLFGPIGTVLGGFDELQRAAAGLARLVGVLELPARPAVPRLVGRPAATVELQGVGYRYPGSTGPALHGVDLALAAGETVAVVGRTGAGKTTIAALVAGVLDGHTGRIVIDGRPVDGAGSGPGDRGVALVTQEAHVFSGPLREDLRLARPDASDAELTDALATAGALDWCRSLPDGLDTVVGIGGRALSPFEAQRLAIARSYLTAARVLVLDEATAEAGSSGTRDLDRAVERMRAGRTTLIVAHRLDQAARADRVIVLDQGRVVENGPHVELVALGGRYTELWRAWQDERSPAVAPKPARR